jgi:hypothetical protein
MELEERAVDNIPLYGSEVYSQILRYIDIAPVSTTHARGYESQYHWLERLRTQGPYKSMDDINNYKSIYTTLAVHGFNVDRAFLSACAANLIDVSRYLSFYSSEATKALCVESSTDPCVAKSIHIDRLGAVLYAVADDREKVTALLSTTVLERGQITDAEIYHLMQSATSDIVATALEDTLIDIAAPMANSAAANVFDARGYTYPIDSAMKYDLLHSVEQWVHSNPTQASLHESLIKSVAHNKKSSVILLKALKPQQRQILSLIEFAIKSNNYYTLKELPYTAKDLNLAIALDALQSIEAMKSVAGQQHIKQCVSQRRVQARKILIGRTM